MITTNASAMMATPDSVGDWDGNEQAAANGFNLIIMAMIELAKASEENCDDRLQASTHHAWDVFGSDISLLEMTASRAEKHAEELF